MTRSLFDAQSVKASSVLLVTRTSSWHKAEITMTQLALAFLRLGLTTFGGPAAHIAMMEQEFVRRRQWLTKALFLDLLGAASLIPGPSSSELAIYIGQRRAGWRGLVLGGFCFILPAALIVTAVARGYVRYHSLPAVSGILLGIKPVIVAVIFQAVSSLLPTALKSKPLCLIGIAAVIAASLGVSFPVLLLVCGLLSATVSGFFSRFGLAGVGGLATAFEYYKRMPSHQIESAVVPVTLSRLFLFFLKVGSIQYGSGYVLLAYLRDDLVRHWHWLTEAQLIDATAVGQFTPGPVFTTATFIGYVLQGPWGAFVATLGIFLPAFILVGLSGSLIPRIRESRFAGTFLDGVNVASLALMVLVSLQLAVNSVTGYLTAVICAISLTALLKFRVNSVWLILAGGAIGYFSF